MSSPHQRRYTAEEVSEIVQRALEDARDGDETVSYDELVETAGELGITPSKLEAAIQNQNERGAIEKIKKRIIERKRKSFFHHLRSYLITNGALMIINLVTSADYLWFFWPLLGWGIGIAFHANDTFFVSDENLEASARRKLRSESRRKAKAGSKSEGHRLRGEIRYTR